MIYLYTGIVYSNKKEWIICIYLDESCRKMMMDEYTREGYLQSDKISSNSKCSKNNQWRLNSESQLPLFDM